MRAALIAAALSIAAIQAARAEAPRWTILHTDCIHLSATAGQCAVNLLGDFASRAACLAANNGQLQQRGRDKTGLDIGYRCEMLLRE